MKGGAERPCVQWRGKNGDWVLFIDDVDQYKEWKAAQQQADAADDDADDAKDASFVVPSFVIGKDEIFVTDKHSPQGTASIVKIAAEFETENKKQAIRRILLEGTVVEAKFPERQGPKNDSMGSMAAH